MCKIMEDWKIEIENEAKAIEAYQIALKMLEKGKYSFDEIVDLTGFTLEEVQEIAKENNIAVKT